MRGKQSVRKGVWYIGGRRKRRKRKIVKRQRGKGFPTGLLASAAAPFLGEIAKPILKKSFRWSKKKTMRQNVLLRRRVMPQRVRLPNGTLFLARQEQVSRKNLTANVTIRRTRTIGPRNKVVRKQKVRFALPPAQKAATQIVKKYRRQRRKKGQIGGSLIGNLAKWRINMGAKAINSGLGEKIVDEGIKHAPDLYKYGTSKIKNKKIQRAHNSDIANYMVEEAQNKANSSVNNLFGGIQCVKESVTFKLKKP